MKKLLIQVIVGKENIAELLSSEGFDKDNMDDQLEILGILENLKNVQQEKIKFKFRGEKK